MRDQNEPLGLENAANGCPRSPPRFSTSTGLWSVIISLFVNSSCLFCSCSFIEYLTCVLVHVLSCHNHYLGSTCALFLLAVPVLVLKLCIIFKLDIQYFAVWTFWAVYLFILHSFFVSVSNSLLFLLYNCTRFSLYVYRHQSETMLEKATNLLFVKFDLTLLLSSI